jgi:peptide chain release factor subunit 1
MKKLHVHEGVLRAGLLAELEAFRAPEQRVSSYYLPLDGRYDGDSEAARLVVKNALAQQRERLQELNVRPAVRHALQHDWQIIEELALSLAGQRGTRALACFVASASGYGRAFRLPWPVRARAFFEERFVLWPLYQILDQADRYALCLTDKDDARIFLYYLGQTEEVFDIHDDIPGRIRFPDPFGELEYARKHVESFHHHFTHVAEALLRLFQREPFAHLIIGGHGEILSQFESHLHRYLRDRLVARWVLEVRTPLPALQERLREEEQQVLRRQAERLWQTIQAERLLRGALGPEETFAALWQRRVQALLLTDNGHAPGYRCSSCGRLHLHAGPCKECQNQTQEVPDIFEEALHEALEQGAQVRYWNEAALKEVGGLAAWKRY